MAILTPMSSLYMYECINLPHCARVLDIRDQIPRKYQSKEELKKLENILLYIKNRQSGITIADLVRHSGLAVIKSKEILQTLMKLELIHRDHEKSVRTKTLLLDCSSGRKDLQGVSPDAGLCVHVRQRTLATHTRPSLHLTSLPRLSTPVSTVLCVFVPPLTCCLCEDRGLLFNSCWLVLMHKHRFARGSGS